ncbi:MAG: type II toxin-antitoxin system RelB/DinJ family antitoxin [Pseudomonadota bacterium]
MAKEIQIAFREDPDIKRKAAAIVRSMGLDLSSALRMFLRQVIRTKSLPLRMESGYSQEGERAIFEALREFSMDRKAGRGRTYESTKEFFDDLANGK